MRAQMSEKYMKMLRNFSRELIFSWRTKVPKTFYLLILFPFAVFLSSFSFFTLFSWEPTRAAFSIAFKRNPYGEKSILPSLAKSSLWSTLCPFFWTKMFRLFDNMHLMASGLRYLLLLSSVFFSNHFSQNSINDFPTPSRKHFPIKSQTVSRKQFLVYIQMFDYNLCLRDQYYWANINGERETPPLSPDSARFNQLTANWF